jgi:hypothetical protein
MKSKNIPMQKIRQFCEYICGSRDLQFLTRNVSGSAQEEQCFNNVEDRVANEGGQVLWGWYFVYRKERGVEFLQAINHAVWKNADTLIDVTPYLQERKPIIISGKLAFLADEKADPTKLLPPGCNFAYALPNKYFAVFRQDVGKLRQLVRSECEVF